MKEFQLVNFQLVSNFQLICEREKFQLVTISKTLLKSKGRISFRGSIYIVKGEAFETGERSIPKIQILKFSQTCSKFKMN
jgi:hypothetical protein